MKVCFVAGTLGLGGAEKQLFYMLRALQQIGVKVSVICLTRGENYEGPIRDLGIEVEWVGATKSRTARLLSIVNKIRDRKVDIVQSSHFYSNIYAGFASRMLGLRCLGAIRNDLTSELGANGVFGKWQLRMPGHLLANSRSAIKRAELLGIAPRRLHFLGNVVEVGSAIDRWPKSDTEDIRLLFIGRLASQKNPELFVHLASRLLNEFSGRRLTFEVAGDGPLRGRLEHLVSECGLSEKQFIFTGSSTHTDTIYQRADIVVLTSDHEGTPNVLLEAMAHGLPIVATKAGGVTEILDFNSEYLVPPRDLDGLVKASANLISSTAARRRLGELGSRYVADNHSPSSLAKKLLNIYSSINQH